MLTLKQLLINLQFISKDVLLITMLLEWKNYKKNIWIKCTNGYNLSDDIHAIDAELVETVINKLERGKAADIHGLSAEHLFCNPIISVVLATQSSSN